LARHCKRIYFRSPGRNIGFRFSDDCQKNNFVCQKINLKKEINPTTQTTMNYFPHKILLTMIVSLSLSACGNLSNEVEKKLNELESKTDSLDTNQGLDANRYFFLFCS
jgi:hypothetical protein